MRIAQSIDSLSNDYTALENTAGYESMRDARTLAMLGFATILLVGLNFQLAAYASSKFINLVITINLGG